MNNDLVSYCFIGNFIAFLALEKGLFRDYIKGRTNGEKESCHENQR